MLQVYQRNPAPGIVVSTSDVRLAPVIEALLEPFHFSRSEGQDNAWKVRMDRENRVLFKGPIVRLEHDLISVFRYTGSKREYFSENGTWSVSIDDANRVIDIHVLDACVAQVMLRRVVRQIMAAETRFGGGMILHASAAELDGKAVVFVGNKGAGKTTALLELLVAGWRYLANDACIILGSGWVVPWLGGLDIAPSTLTSIRGISDRIEIDSRVGKKIHIPPEQIQNATGSAISNGGRVKLLVFPNFLPSCDEIRLSYLQRNHATKLIGINATSEHRVDHPHWVVQVPASSRKVPSTLAESKAFDLTFGTDRSQFLDKIHFMLNFEGDNGLAV